MRKRKGQDGQRRTAQKPVRCQCSLLKPESIKLFVKTSIKEIPIPTHISTSHDVPSSRWVQLKILGTPSGDCANQVPSLVNDDEYCCCCCCIGTDTELTIFSLACSSASLRLISRATRAASRRSSASIIFCSAVNFFA
jgi:hypothetical protein